MANPFREELQQRQGGSQDGGAAQRRGGNPFRREMGRRGADSPDVTFLNQGIARSLGAPVDIANELLGLADLDAETPVGGRESIETAMRFLGDRFNTQMLPREGEEPGDFGEAILRGTGDAAGGLIPFGGVAGQVAQRARGPVQQAAQTAVRQFRTPARAAGAGAVEGTLGAASGAGGQVAAEAFPETDEARAMGEIAGGLGLPLAATGATVIPSVLAMRLARNAIRPLTPSQGPGRAGERLRELESQPGQAARNLQQQRESELTPAQRTGERRFMELEATRRRDDPEFDRQVGEQQARAGRQLRQGARDIGGDARVSRTRAFLNERLNQFTNRVNERLRRLNPRQREAEASNIVREELDSALQRARQRESQLFERVPDDVRRPTETTRQTFRDILAERDPAVDDPADIPDFLTSIIGRETAEGFKPGKLGGEASVRRLQRLRSRVLEEIRAERAKEAPNRRRLSILGDVQEAVLRDIGAQAGQVQGEAGQRLRDALDFSRQLNERFTQGSVGRVLGFDRRGGPSVAPESTLEATVGRRGGQGIANTRQLLSAVQDAPERTRAQIEDFIKTRFQQAAARQGPTGPEIDPQAARRFLDQNQELVDQFPDLRANIQRAIEGQADLDDFRRSNVQRFLNSREGEEIRNILQAQNPGRAAREILAEAGRDQSEMSVQGLKSALREFILEKATTSQFDEAGQAAISGRAMRAQLQDRRLRPVLNALLSDAEKTKLGRLAREFEILEQASGARPRSEGLINDAPNRILSTPARIIGAQVGGQLGASSAGGSLQTAQIFSGRAREFVQRLTNDKAQELLARSLEPGNEGLFRALLTNVRDNRRAQRFVNQRLNAFLAGPGSDLLTDTEGATP